jgi:hypothetical protein
MEGSAGWVDGGTFRAPNGDRVPWAGTMAAGRSREGVQAARLKRGSWHDENPFLV